MYIYHLGVDGLNIAEVYWSTLWWTNIAMENHHFSWENPLFLWPCSIAMLVHQRVSAGFAWGRELLDTHILRPWRQWFALLLRDRSWTFHDQLAEGQEGFSQASEATALSPRQLGTLHSTRVALLASLTLPAWSPIFPCRFCLTL